MVMKERKVFILVWTNYTSLCSSTYRRPSIEILGCAVLKELCLSEIHLKMWKNICPYLKSGDVQKVLMGLVSSVEMEGLMMSFPLSLFKLSVIQIMVVLGACLLFKFS